MVIGQQSADHETYSDEGMRKLLDRLPPKVRLVVLIKVILCGVLIAIVGIYPILSRRASREKMRKARAMAVCTELEAAVNRFVNDNGTLPVDIFEDTAFTSNSAQGLEMLRVLFNIETTPPLKNIKGINYLHIKQGKNDADGLIYNDSGDVLEGLCDPWGGDYTICLDGDLDNKIDVQPKGAAFAKTLNGRTVAVWSDGNDGVSETGNSKDDVTPW